MDKSGFVGVFDSGVGGVSVLKSLTAELPHEDFVYFGDTANNPYGQKTTDEIMRFSKVIVGNLIDRGAKAIVIACNTATSVAAQTLRELYPETPIIGVEPALKPACEAAPGSRILVMATPVTLRLEKFQKLISTYAGSCEVVALPCPGLASRIEQGNLDAPDLKELIAHLAEGVLAHDAAGATESAAPTYNSVVLGCTHYPFAAKQIKEVMGDVHLFDGSAGTSRRLRNQLMERGLLSESDQKGSVIFESSSPDPKTIELYRTFYKLPTMLS